MTPEEWKRASTVDQLDEAIKAVEAAYNASCGDNTLPLCYALGMLKQLRAKRTAIHKVVF